MNKAIKKMSLVDLVSKKKTAYTVVRVELTNGSVSDVFVDSETLNLVNTFGREKVLLDYVSRVSKDGKAFSAIELKLKDSAKMLDLEEDYTALCFLSRPVEALIKFLSRE